MTNQGGFCGCQSLVQLFTCGLLLSLSLKGRTWTARCTAAGSCAPQTAPRSPTPWSTANANYTHFPLLPYYPPLPLPPHQPQPIARRVVQVLPQSQVALGGLDRCVPQANLDLLERRAAEVGELGEGSS